MGIKFERVYKLSCQGKGCDFHQECCSMQDAIEAAEKHIENYDKDEEAGNLHHKIEMTEVEEISWNYY